ncbi:hypothetical protein ACMD2_04812 [Ananas comosus]|uniref:Uncharacterized protein n=1 Tax=Ananas comosus TaxID=4615 RepID=A0A199V259_ANACO|nr:hypothetical protein ACMD2_04812 [Ananas comosus]
MGNCMGSCATRKEEREEREEVKIMEEGVEGHTNIIGGEKESGCKVKILLTKRELQWLVLQMKSGERRVEDVLVELSEERERDKGSTNHYKAHEGWRPSLDSIMECPEIQTFV